MSVVIKEIYQGDGSKLEIPREGSTSEIIPIVFDKEKKVFATKKENGEVERFGGGSKLVEAFEVFDKEVLNAWGVVTIPNCPPNVVADICITTGTGTGDRTVGVREVGSVIERKVVLKKNDTPMTMRVNVNDNSQIEIFKSEASVSYCITGFNY